GARDAEFAVLGLTVVPQGGDVTSYLDSGRELVAALAPWLHEGTHPSFMAPADATEDGVRRAYDPDVYDELRRVKSIYDPKNIFRVNNNMPPSAPSEGYRVQKKFENRF